MAKSTFTTRSRANQKSYVKYRQEQNRQYKQRQIEIAHMVKIGYTPEAAAYELDARRAE